MKHKDDNCHINTKKYFRTPEIVHKFLSTLKRIDKRPIDRSFEQTIRSILRQRPSSKNPMDWMVWKNKLLQEFEPIANVPDDLCELMIPTDSSSKSDVSSTPYSAFESLPLRLMSPVPFEAEFKKKLISNDPEDHTAPLGFPVEVYLWKDCLSPIIKKLDPIVSNMIQTILQHDDIIPHLIPCKKDHTKRFLKNGTTKEDTYTYALVGGFAYRILGTYLHQQYPTLPVFEDIVIKGQDYDINFIINEKTADSFPIDTVFDILRSFSDTIYTLFHPTWNKQHSISKNGIIYEVQFIKPSPSAVRSELTFYNYYYIHDRFLVSVGTYSYNNQIISISYQITLCLQIKTSTETYCYTDHILDILFLIENEKYDPPYKIQQESWFPALSIIKLLSLLAKEKPIHSIPMKELFHQFQIGKHIYQLPNINGLLLQSMNGMVLRIAMENSKSYKARQDYARIYTILRMLETIPDEPILTKKEIQYIYTTLQSITMPSNWKTLSDAKKHAMIQQYKDALQNPSKQEHLPWKETRIKTTIVDKYTKKIKQITQEYYKGPYEECRINPKEEDPLLWELGHAKFMVRKQIIDKIIEKELPETRRKSCDGTAPVKRRTVKKRSTGHKTRKHRSI